MFGSPGSGKGTQGLEVAQQFGLFYYSLGDHFRRLSQENSERGRYLKRQMKKYCHLIPGKITTKVTFSEIDGRGSYLMDGFPRIVRQAKSLEGFNPPDIAILLSVPDSVSLDRQENRKVCEACGRVYSIAYPPFMPLVPGFCNDDNSRLIEREDAKVHVAESRLVEYHKGTGPLEEFYQNLGKLIVIDGNKNHDEVRREIVSALESIAKRG